MLDTIQTLNIIQYNVNKSRNRVMTSLFKSLDPQRYHILAVQEPWRNPQMSTTSRPPNYHLIYPLSKDTRVCFHNVLDGVAQHAGKRDSTHDVIISTHADSRLRELWLKIPSSVALPHVLRFPVKYVISKAINQNRWTTTEHSPDLVTLMIYLDGRTLHIHECYNSPPKLLTSRNLATLQLLPQALSHLGEHILV
jgi:hypothetical protein